MCNAGVEANPSQLYDVPDNLKMQKMCDDVVRMDSYSLLFDPDWFVTQEQLEIWHSDDEYCNDDEIIELYKVYQKHKAWKVKIKEELLPIAWHPDLVMDWCMSEDKKRWWK